MLVIFGQTEVGAAYTDLVVSTEAGGVAQLVAGRERQQEVTGTK